MSVHSTRLENWLGTDRLTELSRAMNGWYGPNISLIDCPGDVYLTKDGDFVGNFNRGYFASAMDYFTEKVKKMKKELFLSQVSVLNAGFTSIGDALSRASAGNSQLLNGTISKVGPTGVTGGASSLWRVGNQPAAGGAGSAAPGGRALTDATTGAMAFSNPSSGTLHLVGADFSSSVVNNAVMLYDRIFDVAKTMNSTGTESVTGVPTRYQSSTASAADYAGGNFLFIEVGGTALAATAHNWTVCQYRNQAGTDAQTLPSIAGNSGTIVDRFDMPLNNWFCPLATGDTGVMDLSQMQCSAAVATGVINFVIGHPIGVMAFPVLNSLLPFDWLTNRMQTPRIFDDAALAMFELPKPSATAATYTGMIYVTSAAP